MHWSANPSEAGYKKHGYIGMSDKATKSSWSGRVHQHEGMRSDRPTEQPELEIRVNFEKS